MKYKVLLDMRKRYFDLFAAIVLLTVASISYFGSSNYLLSNFQALAFQILLGLSGLTLCFLLARRWILLSAGLISMFILGFSLGDILIPEKNMVGKADVTVAHFNVLQSNGRRNAVMKKIGEVDADLISLQEMDEQWLFAADSSLSTKYPYQSKKLWGRNYGLAVFSKFPIHNETVTWWGGVPNIVGSILINQQSVQFLSSHTSTPMSSKAHQNRNRHLACIAEYIADQDGPVIAMGDYNCVPWSREINSFKKFSGLKDSRKRFAATYPSKYSLLRIPIDYLWHSKDFDCLRFHVMDIPGSDHRGIAASYRFSTKNKLAQGKTP